MKRPRPSEIQAEMPFSVPVPARGTVVIMRIEDYRESGYPTPRPPPKKPAKNQRASNLSAIEPVRAWIAGDFGGVELLGKNVRCNEEGRVIAATAADAARALAPDRFSTGASRVAAAGRALEALGWKRRYVTDADDPTRRARVWFAPGDSPPA
jgi:hypothetical protein